MNRFCGATLRPDRVETHDFYDKYCGVVHCTLTGAGAQASARGTMRIIIQSGAISVLTKREPALSTISRY